jgi:peptidoglycan/xylan/chitin deacetylase (PgdA/CDA1 family)
MLNQAKQMGLVTVEWTVSPRDWNTPPRDIIVKRIVARVKNGGIVLLHDGTYHNKPADRSPTVAALPLLIQGLRARGFELVTIPELLGLRP